MSPTRRVVVKKGMKCSQVVLEGTFSCTYTGTNSNGIQLKVRSEPPSSFQNSTVWKGAKPAKANPDTKGDTVKQAPPVETQKHTQKPSHHSKVLSKPVQPKSRRKAPCDTCLKSRCSNCLVPFKKGDKVVKKIPSKEVARDHSEKFVPLEIALICIFEPNNPYPKWIQALGKTAELPSHLIELLDDEQDPNKNIQPSDSTSGGASSKETKVNQASSSATKISEDVEKRLIALFEEVEISMKQLGKSSVALYLALVKKKMQEFDDGKPDVPTSAEVKAYLIRKLEEFQAKKAQEVLEISAAREAAKLGTREVLQDFQFCIGCAELVTVLFTAWENLRANRLTEESYFYAVMLGFQHATKAQEVIFRAPKSSKMYIFNKYGKECHPVGCQQRSFPHGIKINIGTKKEDLVRNSVGNLHAGLEEGYRRVHDEMMKLCEHNFVFEDDVKVSRDRARTS